MFFGVSEQDSLLAFWDNPSLIPESLPESSWGSQCDRVATEESWALEAGSPCIHVPIVVTRIVSVLILLLLFGQVVILFFPFRDLMT